MLAVPAGVERDLGQWEICVGNFLPCVFMPVAIFIDHDCCSVLDRGLDNNKPIRRANFHQMACDGIHHPKTLRLLGKVLGAIRQQMPSADSVVALCAREFGQRR